MITLVPVIEIVSDGGDIPLPPGPSLAPPDEWDRYNQVSNTKAGYSDQLKPYRKGSHFYRIDTLTDKDLSLAVKAAIRVQQGEEEVPELFTAFYGGYILWIADEDYISRNAAGRWPISGIQRFEMQLSLFKKRCLYLPPGCSGSTRPKSSIFPALINGLFGRVHKKNGTPGPVLNLLF